MFSMFPLKCVFSGTVVGGGSQNQNRKFRQSFASIHMNAAVATLGTYFVYIRYIYDVYWLFSMRRFSKELNNYCFKVICLQECCSVLLDVEMAFSMFWYNVASNATYFEKWPVFDARFFERTQNQVFKVAFS